LPSLAILSWWLQWPLLPWSQLFSPVAEFSATTKLDWSLLHFKLLSVRKTESTPTVVSSSKMMILTTMTTKKTQK
jgi:hypothetical protein